MLRKISTALTMVLLGGLWALPATVSAQDENMKRENVDYYRVVNINFKPGHNQAAWAILYGKIAPAVTASGGEFVALDWESGPWDTTVYIKLEDGYGTLEYATSPGFIRLMAELAKTEGSKAAAEAVWDEWQSHIDTSSADVAHMHRPPAEEAD